MVTSFFFPVFFLPFLFFVFFCCDTQLTSLSLFHSLILYIRHTKLFCLFCSRADIGTRHGHNINLIYHDLTQTFVRRAKLLVFYMLSIIHTLLQSLLYLPVVIPIQSEIILLVQTIYLCVHIQKSLFKTL